MLENYDNLLEDATGRTAITWRKADKVQEVLRREITDAVLHFQNKLRDAPWLQPLGYGAAYEMASASFAARILDQPRSKGAGRAGTVVTSRPRGSRNCGRPSAPSSM